MLKRLVRVTPLVFLLAFNGCGNRQQTIATLVITLGHAVSMIATVQNNPEFAAKILADTQRLTQVVLEWKPGPPTDHVRQAIQVVRTDLDTICDRITNCAPYKPLIAFALQTLDSILAMVNNDMKAVSGATAPQTSEEFEKGWDGIAAQNPATVPVEIH